MAGSTESAPITIAEIKAIAKRKLPEPVWDYYTTGAEDEQTARRNEDVFHEYAFC